jgi:biopolymer transport protein ExbB/TolQ
MEAYATIVGFFQSGGVFMYPIVVVLALGMAIAIERYAYLGMSSARNRREWNRFQPMLEGGKFQQALSTAGKSKTAISKILSYALTRSKTARRREDLEMAMEEGLMEVIPRLERRTHYLATFANIATLLGLLGTIIGLIEAFTAVSNASPAEKADLLSASISVAMNTTAFGLMVGIPLLLVHALLQTKTTELVDSIEMASVKLLNLITNYQRSEAPAQ